MVQEKDAAKKRVEHRKNFLKEEMERLDRESPVVATKWAVEEVRPAYNTGGYYDEDVPEDALVVSPHFDSREEAEAWMDAHEADEGKYLALVKEVGREYRHIQWTKTRVRK